MSRRTGALPIEQALETALQYCHVTEPETCSIGDCADRVLAEDMRAAISSPPFRRSAMDGFAVRSEDLCGASGQKPVVLTVLGDGTDHDRRRPAGGGGCRREAGER